MAGASRAAMTLRPATWPQSPTALARPGSTASLNRMPRCTRATKPAVTAGHCHRWLIEQGVDNIVVDSSSIEVNCARRAKTDRLDGDKLLAMLLRHRCGERVWSVVHPAHARGRRRAPHASRARPTEHGERTSHTNRISSLLVLHNLRRTSSSAGATGPPGGSVMALRYHRYCAPRLTRECTAGAGRGAGKVKAMEAKRRRNWPMASSRWWPNWRNCAPSGRQGAWVLVKELFGWRRLADRRELAGCLGFVPTPYDSGASQTEQGISKAGNKRVHSLLVALAWCWLRLQPQSALTQWFNQRFAGGGKRMRRVGIVALARKLAITLWRYLQYGEIPAGALLKPAAA